MRPGALNLLVFREDRRCVCGAALRNALLGSLETLDGRISLDQVTNVLLRAGELECALADVADSAPTNTLFKDVTDRVAEALLSLCPAITRHGYQRLDVGALRKTLNSWNMPKEVEVAPPEGFAYYALHPLAYVEALDRLPPLPPSVVVLGIRSIGTTLSAVAAAGLRARDVQAVRITVRPVGHPYNRRTRFSPAQLGLIRERAAQGAAFLIVDEGPGLSGSSFLSVAEALVEAGVSREYVTFICGREPLFESLCAEDGPQRARKFRWLAVFAEPRRPIEAEIFVGGGEWRSLVYPQQKDWPAAWTSFERLKYLSSGASGERRFFKFAGLGHYGERVREREESVAVAGFGLRPRTECAGFASYPWVAGRPMSVEDLSPDTVARLASYFAFRVEAFVQDRMELHALQEMTEHNLQALGAGRAEKLKLERPVVADGRMQPHEWLFTAQGEMLKTDSGGHGDDHFFPGVTDIAWDLAGAIVEWKMSAAQAEAFLEAYRRASGDDAKSRIAGFVTAYAAFRWAYCKMAANALWGSDEAARLETAADRYAAVLGVESPDAQCARQAGCLSTANTATEPSEIKPISQAN